MKHGTTQLQGLGISLLSSNVLFRKLSPLLFDFRPSLIFLFLILFSFRDKRKREGSDVLWTECGMTAPTPAEMQLAKDK